MINIKYLDIVCQTLRGPKNKGYTILICDNTTENIDLIKHSSSNDIWFHSYVTFSEKNVVLKSYGDYISEYYLKKVIELTGLEKPVMYTTIDNLEFKLDNPNMIFPKNVKFIL